MLAVPNSLLNSQLQGGKGRPKTIENSEPTANVTNNNSLLNGVTINNHQYNSAARAGTEEPLSRDYIYRNQTANEAQAPRHQESSLFRQAISSFEMSESKDE